MGATVRLENLTLGYERHPAVHHVSGRFEAGSLTAITGPNGAGKSTLLKGIAGIITPDEGRIVIENISASSVAYLPQAIDLQRDFPLSIMQMVAMGGWNKAGSFGKIGKVLKQKILEALDATDLRGFEHRQVGTLSVGQFQRALFARALVQDAQLILLDEPFTAIDADTIARLLAIIGGWHKEGRTVICVLHDIAQIRNYFPNCLLLARECVAWGRSDEALNPEHLFKANCFREAWSHQTEVCPQ